MNKGTDSGATGRVDHHTHPPESYSLYRSLIWIHGVFSPGGLNTALLSRVHPCNGSWGGNCGQSLCSSDWGQRGGGEEPPVTQVQLMISWQSRLLHDLRHQIVTETDHSGKEIPVFSSIFI